MRQYKIVEIEWTDAVVGSSETWAEPSELTNKPMPSKTVGYLIKKSKDAVTVAALQNKSHLGLTLVIQRRMIDKMTELTAVATDDII